MKAAGGALIVDQPSGKAAKSRLAFLYQPIPLMGFLQRPFISFKARSCVVSPFSTMSFRWRSCALMTSSAVMPWCARSHGPPNCWHVMVFMRLVSFRCVGPSTASRPRNTVRIHPNPDHIHGRQHVWIGNQLHLAHQARPDMEHEGHLDVPGVDPGGAELTVDRDRCSSP